MIYGLKQFRLQLKHFYHKLRLKQSDFSVISNNCWGTRTFQRFGLPYTSPFQSLFIYAPDYIALLKDFSLDKLEIIDFISPEASKYFSDLSENGLLETPYPIGILRGGTELHFLHYKTSEDAKEKWDRRVRRINPEKLVFKFSDGYLATEEHIRAFDALPYPNKLCFTARPYPELSNVVYMPCFAGKPNVDLEWKQDRRYINLYRFFNSIRPTTI